MDHKRSNRRGQFSQNVISDGILSLTIMTAMVCTELHCSCYAQGTQAWTYHPCTSISTLALNSTAHWIQTGAYHIQGPSTCSWHGSRLPGGAPEEAPRTPRSNSLAMLQIPRTRLKYYGNRAFVKAALSLWNALLQQLRQMSTLAKFKSVLKTHLFQVAYSWSWSKNVLPLLYIVGILCCQYFSNYLNITYLHCVFT